jgi:hypothetical protein
MEKKSPQKHFVNGFILHRWVDGIKEVPKS